MKKQIVLLLIVGVFVMCSSATAEIWTNGTGNGLWSDAGNWDGVSFPGTYWITDPALGTATISGSYAASSTGYAVLGQGIAGVAAVEINDTSSLTVSGPFYVGNAAGAGAIAEIRLNDSAQLSTTGAVGWIELGQIGGDNRLIATGNSQINADYAVFVGNWAGSTGSVDLSGFASLTTADFNVGISGIGNVDIADSASLNVSGGIRLGTYVAGASFGTMNVNGGAVTSGLSEIGVDEGGLLQLIGGTYDTGLLDIGDVGSVLLSGSTVTATDLNLNLAGSLAVTGGSMTILGIDKTAELGLWEALGQFSGSYAFDGTDTVITPEPATMALMAIGGLAALRRKRR